MEQTETKATEPPLFEDEFEERIMIRMFLRTNMKLNTLRNYKYFSSIFEPKTIDICL